MSSCSCNCCGADNAVAKILKNYEGAGQDALIPILQDIQTSEGFLSPDAIIQVGRFLKLHTSKIYGVATFYNQFRFQPVGKNHIQVCRGTACHVKGSADVQTALEEEIGVKAGTTSDDGLFSLEVVACIGACGLAPVITLNGDFHANMSPDKARKLIQNIRKG